MTDDPQSPMGRRHCVRALAVAALAAPGGWAAQAQEVGATTTATAAASAGAPPWWPAQLAPARLMGQGRLRFWGLDVYDALLWAAPDFEASRYAQQPFGLELVYLRALKGRLIAERSLKEMQALPGYDAARAERWLAAMAALFPDVSAQDRLTGIHLPGQGAQFWLNGQPRGEVADALFARLFFGIWLSPQTSEPRLRQALLGQAERP